MSDNTKIEWCDSTFNPWEGCTKISPGCDHCYAEARNNRFQGGNWGVGSPRRRTSEANWRKPIKWNRNAGEFFRKHGRRRRVFCASLADVFDNEVDPQWRADLFWLIYNTPNLDWLLLTKRIGNAASMIERALIDGHLLTSGSTSWPWPHVWLGATVVNQEEADRDIPKLLKIPAKVRFVSAEPLLGPLDFQLGFCDHKYYSCEEIGCWSALDWIIVGGESGPGARPMHSGWARSLRDQCQAGGVSFFMKQMSGARRGAMPLIPGDLIIREFPVAKILDGMGL